MPTFCDALSAAGKYIPAWKKEYYVFREHTLVSIKLNFLQRVIRYFCLAYKNTHLSSVGEIAYKACFGLHPTPKKWTREEQVKIVKLVQKFTKPKINWFTTTGYELKYWELGTKILPNGNTIKYTGLIVVGEAIKTAYHFKIKILNNQGYRKESFCRLVKVDSEKLDLEHSYELDLEHLYEMQESHKDSESFKDDLVNITSVFLHVITKNQALLNNREVSTECRNDDSKIDCATIPPVVSNFHASVLSTMQKRREFLNESRVQESLLPQLLPSIEFLSSFA